MAVALYVVLFALYFDLSRGEWAALLLTIGLVMGAEALNTAVERTVDLACRERCETARIAKDAAAGAVLLCAMAAVGVGIALFARGDVWLSILADFRACIWKPLLLLLSVPLAVWFVTAGGSTKKPLPPVDGHDKKNISGGNP